MALPSLVWGKSLLGPVKRPKNDPPWPPEIKMNRYPTSGIELAAKAKRALQREVPLHELEPKTYLWRYFAEPLRHRLLAIDGAYMRH